MDIQSKKYLKKGERFPSRPKGRGLQAQIDR